MTSWVPMVSAILGGAVTLSAVYFTNKWNADRFDKQLKHERKKENSKLFLEKGEELDELLSIWSKTNFLVKRNQLLVVKGKLTEVQLLEIVSKHSNKNNHDRLEVLLNIYFPEQVIYMEEAIKIRAKGNAAYDDFISGKLECKTAFIIIHNSEVGFSDKIDDLRKSIRDRLHKLIES
ncbi:hypothetical protein FE394_18895 [Xenorhabdus sp. Reich]|uniref:Uncharacterized protein n=1 Tax=Xenorhabdus littoralis TaxID=2582835 RepID=A0ABU4SRC0_9GAMM|nr:hypothetical protein [Xenorhabdus sp. Reich]MDX8001188.1 hypothetical protein [Xenorhabdus sp. Reich]